MDSPLRTCRTCGVPRHEDHMHDGICELCLEDDAEPRTPEDLMHVEEIERRVNANIDRMIREGWRNG